MTKKDYTALIYIIDRSGSMHSIAQELEGALKELVENEAKEEGHFTVDTVFFNENYEERNKLSSPEDVDFTINPRGMTAMLDAIGKKLTEFAETVDKMPEKDKPKHVLITIATDGRENSSHEYDSKGIGILIDAAKKDRNWKFTFLGANQDAVMAAELINIDKHAALTFRAGAVGTMNMVNSLNAYTRSVRSGDVSAAYSDEDREKALEPDTEV